MPRLTPVAAALFAGLMALLSQGTIGVSGADGQRLAVLPLTLGPMVIATAAAIAVIVSWRLGASLLPLSILGFLILPWLPFPVPAAFLLWVRPVTIAIWAAAVLLMIASMPARPRVEWATPRRIAALAAFVLFSLSAWRAAPMVPGGDEPHYLIIAQSLLLDGDLTIEDVHRRADYRAYFPGDLAPHVQRRGRDGRIYSVHAPGLPVLVAPAFAVAGYHGVVVFLLVVASAGSALAWHLAWLATGRTGAAWFAWAAVTLPVTAVFQSFTVYPDGIGGVLALTGLWALVRADLEMKTGGDRAMPWLWHGMALALLPWFHSRFAVLAACLGALVLLRLSTTPNPAAKAVAFLSVPAISAMLWVGFFIAIYGTPDPTAPYASGELGSMRFVPGGLGGLLFDQRFGLVTYAPVLAFAILGIGMMIGQRRWRRLGLELLFVVVPYLITVTHFAMWWGGWSPPARFFAPVLPLLALPAAVAWTLIVGRAARVLASASLVLTALASAIVVWVDRGRLAFNTRDAPALWLEWLGRVGDLAAAAPMWARDTDVPLFRGIAIWLGVAVAAWLVLRSQERSARLASRTAFLTLAAVVLASSVMAGASVMWAFERSTGRTAAASQLQLLEAVASHNRVVAMQLDRFARVASANVPGRLRIDQMRAAARRPAGREIPPLFVLPSLPAGDYRITVDAADSRGWLMIGIARDSRDPFAIQTVQLPIGTIDVRFPLAVRALVIRGDEDAWRAVRRIAVEPLTVLRQSARLTDGLARRAVRYERATVFFLDDRSFPEPEAFWVGGARDSTVVVQPDRERTSVPIRLRNGPEMNRVTVTSGGWRRVLDLQPEEEHVIDVPIDPTRGAALLRIETTTGFRPAERDPASRDQRFLGVWVKLE